jgi:anti-sigma regulatory factor (Ser/Thr protein kinase)
LEVAFELWPRILKSSELMSAMQLAFSLNDQSQVGEARRQITYLAQELGFDETDCGRVSIVVTELATNLVRYAKEGQILVRAHSSNDQKSIEIHSIDRGPGMSDVGRNLTDGYSTGGTAGTGLGAVQRICNDFDIYSNVPQGTVIFCQIKAKAAHSLVRKIPGPMCLTRILSKQSRRSLTTFIDGCRDLEEERSQFCRSMPPVRR